MDEVLMRAEEHGVSAMICIADSIDESKKCLDMAEKLEQIFCTIGVHPHHAKDWLPESADALARMARSSVRVKAIGEIGLDHHYDFSPRESQRIAFEAQLALAADLGLPVVIHSRESIVDVKAIVANAAPKKAVLHCCTESWEDVADWVERGYLLSFTGIVTYPKSDLIRETVRRCPLERMMIETDAPYLAPVPHRGKRNEPAYVMEVAKMIADIKGMSLAEVDEITTRNTVQFFNLV